MGGLIKYKNIIRKLNILLELLLVLAMYLLAVLLRVSIPIGSEFFRPDSRDYMILGVLFAVINTVVTYAHGKYFSLYINGKANEFRDVLSASMIGFCITCSVIYLMKWEQFSRVLLLYFVVLSFVAMYIKRIIFDKIARVYNEKYNIGVHVLLVGADSQAEVVYKTILEPHYMKFRLVGYVADSENKKMPGYLGTREKLRPILAEQVKSAQIDMILVADPNILQDELQQIVVLATNHNIRIGMVPSFADYLPSKNAINMYKGNYICELTALDSCDIMGVKISVTNMEKTVARIKKHLHEWSGKYICVSNVHTTVTASQDADYRKIQNGAVVALPDGGPLSKFSREKGYSGAERVTGPDLMKRILTMDGSISSTVQPRILLIS